MMLGLDAFRMIGKTPLTRTAKVNSTVTSALNAKKEPLPIKPCSLTTIQKITNIMNERGGMRVLDIVEAISITQSVVYRAFRLMSAEGDLIAVCGPDNNMKHGYYNLTGTGSLITCMKSKGLRNPLSGRSIQSNNTSGLNGVSFIAASNRFIVTFGRGNAWTYDNLLDAACKRKGLDSKLAA